MLNSALILIEFQNEWLAQDGKLNHLMQDKALFESSIEQAKKVLAAARAAKFPVIHSGLCFNEDYRTLGKAKFGLRAHIPQHKTFAQHSNGIKFPAPFTPRENEFIVAGRLGSSAFATSNLDAYLRHNDIQHIYLMGYALHVCVESTMRAGHDLGYEVHLIEDAAAAFTSQQQSYVLNEISPHFAERITSDVFIERMGDQRFNIVGLDHIVLKTNNIKAMLNFYCDILGAIIENVQESINLTQLRIGNNLIDLIEVATFRRDENQVLEHFCIQVKPFDFQWLEKHFISKNIEIYRYGERYSAQGYGPSFYLKDPDGNEVELAGMEDRRE